MQLDRCFTVLSSETVSRDIELGNLGTLVLGGGRVGGNPGGVADTGKEKNSINEFRPSYAFSGVHDF